MNIYTDPRAMQQLCQSFGCGGSAIGFVPTMGALHAGHLELCRRARQENDSLVASIFVNPAQFAANEDLGRYPRPLEADLEQLREVGCDAIFTPDARAMYGDADLLHGTWIDVTPFDEMWEGVTRPGHLRGVATVVAKLFNITQPNVAVFGAKDFQQAAVIKRMTRDLNFPIRIDIAPTHREPDGLAMSSRNKYLEGDLRRQGIVLWRAIQKAQAMVKKSPIAVDKLRAELKKLIESEPVPKLDYVEFFDPDTLVPLEKVSRGAQIALAVFVGKARLIDNARL